MSIRRRLLSGDTTTPQARMLKKGEETGGLDITLQGSTVVENAWDIEIEVEQSGTAGYTADLVNVVETTTGSGDKKLIDRQVGGVSKFSVDSLGGVLANSLPVPTQETGTFTPTFLDATLNDAEGQTYSWQYGFYIKIGRLVQFNLRINCSSLGTLTTTDQLRVGGLPFVSESTAQNYSTVSVGDLVQTGATVKNTGVGVIYNTNAHITMFKDNLDSGSNSNLLISELGAGELLMSGSYWTD